MRALLRRYTGPDDAGTLGNGIVDAVSGIIVFWGVATILLYLDAWGQP